MLSVVEAPKMKEGVVKSAIVLEVSIETAYFGAGPFMYLEAVFRKIRGVHRVTAGFSGGKTENPTF